VDLDSTMKRLMRLGTIPSLSACIIRDNTIAWSGEYGYSNLKQKTPTSKNTMYVLGSASKTITATALMQLYEKGVFDLDDDINEYLPFLLRNPHHPTIPITFRMLLSHQSSLFDHKLGVLKLLSIYRKSRPFPEHPYPWLQELLTPNHRLYEPSLWTKEQPGAQTRYASLGYVILGSVFESLAHQPLEQYCKEHLFEPLHMDHTGFHHSTLPSDDLACPYVYLPGMYVPLPQYDLRFLSPAGGIRTSVDDLAKLFIVHLNEGRCNGKTLLKKETVQHMHSVQYPLSNEYRGKRYGLGWLFWMDKNKPIYDGNAGAIYGFYGDMRRRIADNVAVIFYSNQLKNIIFPNELWAYEKIIAYLFMKAEAL
jgi:CubicO group peptidase (beta-lactamase class C family)